MGTPSDLAQVFLYELRITCREAKMRSFTSFSHTRHFPVASMLCCASVSSPSPHFHLSIHTLQVPPALWQDSFCLFQVYFSKLSPFLAYLTSSECSSTDVLYVDWKHLKKKKNQPKNLCFQVSGFKAALA